MENHIRNQHLERVVITVIGNDPEMGLADFLDALDVDQVVPRENVDTVADELGDPAVNKYWFAVIDGAGHALAPSGDDGQVGGAGVGDAQQVEV